MRALITENRRRTLYGRFSRLDRIMYLCVGLLTMVPAYATIVDSFNSADDLLRTLPRSISAPGTDFTQINTLDGATTADRNITVTAGTVFLNGIALEMPGDSSASMTYSFDSFMDLTGYNAFYFNFDLTDMTEVELVLSGTDDNFELFTYDPVYYTTVSGSFPTASLDFRDANRSIRNQILRQVTLEVYTTGGQNTFSLDEFGVTFVVPLPPALWLFGSGIVGLFGVSRHRKAV